MRMWMVRPDVMCDRHLLGEHVELHMVVGALEKGYERSIMGLVNANLLELEMIEARHEALVVEMTERGMNHQSPLRAPEQLWELPRWGVVCIEDSMRELWRRCLHCRALQRTNHAEVDPMGWILPITHLEESL